MTDVWRYACPEGHRDVRKRGRGPSRLESDREWYYCNTCKKRYEGGPNDLKRTQTHR